MGVCDYCCHYCTRKFFDKYNLERHINANHTKKQQYSCRTVYIFVFKYNSVYIKCKNTFIFFITVYVHDVYVRFNETS